MTERNKSDSVQPDGHGQHSKSRNLEWEAFLEGYRKATKFKEDEQRRLYYFAGAYLAAAIALIGAVVTRSKPEDSIPPLFYAALSLANTFYLIFYSYSSTCLMLSASFLHKLTEESEEYVGRASRFLGWEAFSSSSHAKIRKLVNLPVTAWRLVPLGLAVVLAIYAMDPKDTLSLLVGIISLLWALFGGLLSLVASVAYAIRADRLITRSKRTL